MSEIARRLMLKLLAQADRGGRITLPINERSAKAYFTVTDLAGRDAIHACLENAQAAGGLTLEWGTGAAAQDLKRLRLTNADRLAQWLGVPRAGTRAAFIDKTLGPLLAQGPGWLRHAYAWALSHWRRGHLAFRVPVTDPSAAISLFRMALAVSADEHAGYDLRRFSARLLGDSKAAERLLGKLGELLRRNPEWSHLEDNADLFRLLGLEKFPPPLFIKGPLRLDYAGSRLDISALRPFVGLSPDEVRDVAATGSVPYLLTIENLASFQRHVREIDDAAIVIYTAGFPAPSLIRVLQRLDQCLPTACHCFHWGDRDIGGLRIFAKLAASLVVHSVEPHLMTEDDATTATFAAAEKRQLERYAQRADVTASLARCWLEQNAGPREQELTDPRRPVSG